MSSLRRLQKMHSVALIGGIIFCLILMIQVKQIYENNQKHYRFLGYRQYIEEITAEMNMVEKSANKSSAYVKQLNDALLRHRDREIRNLSLSRMTTTSL